jgi:protein-disulfide isomerase-like protein with CxxC motif
LSELHKTQKRSYVDGRRHVLQQVVLTIAAGLDLANHSSQIKNWIKSAIVLQGDPENGSRAE